MSRPSGKFDGALGALTRKKPEPEATAPERPNVGMSKSPKVDIRESGPVQPTEEKRDRYTTYQFPSLVKEVKRHALDTDVPDYAVVEAALREYLERHRK